MAHKGAHIDLTAKQVRELFDYEPETGRLIWKVQLARRAPVGSVAGASQEKGRIKVGIYNKEYMAHRIIWLWMTGEWPEYEVDHVNEDQSDNRWLNLRHATPSQNHRNRGPQSNNKTGHKGVCFYEPRNVYIAFIKHQQKQHILGHFKTLEEAVKARLEGEKKYHGAWAKPRH